MKRAPRSLQHHVLYRKYNGQDSEISALLGKCGFKRHADANRFLRDLRERLATFGLALHPDKTRLIEFGRYAAAAALGIAVNYGLFALLHRAGAPNAAAIAGGMGAAAIVTFTRFRAIFSR